jgi:putative hemolysin
MPIACPLCDKVCADERGLVFQVLLGRHKHGAELRERIDWLAANLAEAERAIVMEQRNEYRRAVTQVKRLCRLHGFEHGQGAEIA